MRAHSLLLSSLLLAVGCPDSSMMTSDAGIDAPITSDAEATDTRMNESDARDASRADTNIDAPMRDARADALDATADAFDPMMLTLTDFMIEECKSYQCFRTEPIVGPGPCSPEDPLFAESVARTMRAIERGDVVYDEALAQECTAQARMREECAGLPHGCSDALRDVLAVNEACNPLFSFCADELYCDATGVYTGTCLTRGGAGDPCTEHFQCRGTLACDRDLGECEARPTLGELCDDFCYGATCTPVCTSVACEDRCVRYSGGVGDACSALNHTDCDDWLSCVDGACAESAGPGETCRNASFCGAGFRCALIPGEPQPGNGMAVRYCQPGSDLGEACDLSDLCPDNAGCVDDICVAQPRVGEACNPVSRLRCVDNRRCQESICQPPAGEGAECFLDSHCAEGLFCPFSERICVSRPRAAGDICQFDCPSGLYCDIFTDVCIAYLSDGEACQSSRQCFGACSEGVCIPREPI